MNQISETPMYCITHESWVYPELMDYTPKDCILVSSMPPELPEHWDELVTEPTAEELAHMDLNAQEILLDFVA